LIVLPVPPPEVVNRDIKPGEPFQIPTSVPHSLQNGPAPTKLIANFVVEKGKPLASPA